uniref:Uncharacterized protein n=1 Tax=Musa balbisiana TaxID=52838 RepID=B5RHV1_MUSBA|nr:uncharacterized protein [Musa balbisiana]
MKRSEFLPFGKTWRPDPEREREKGVKRETGGNVEGNEGGEAIILSNGGRSNDGAATFVQMTTRVLTLVGSAYT